MTRAVLLYDGDCSLCAKAARRLAAWDLSGRLELKDLRRADLPALDPRLSLDACGARLHLLEPGGRLSVGFDALRRLSALLPALWWAAPALRFPGARLLLEPAYEALQRLRFRLSGPQRHP